MNEMVKVYGRRQHRVHNSKIKDRLLGKFTSALKKFKPHLLNLKIKMKTKVCSAYF